MRLPCLSLTLSTVLLVWAAPALALAKQQSKSVQASASSVYIGIARLEKDGSLVLKVRAQGNDGAVGDAELRYKPSNPEYNGLRSIIGPIQPGQTVPIKAFPEQ